MSKDTILSLVRTVFSAIGAFLIGKNFFGTPLDDNTLQQIIGIVLSLGMTVWSILDKTATAEKIESAIRQAVVFIGGILIALNKTTLGTIEAILGVIAVIVPYIWGIVSRQKAKAIAEGRLGIQDLAGADQARSFKPTLKTPVKEA